MIVSTLCMALIPFMTGCGGTTTPLIYGELLPIASLPAFTSSWEETVTNNKTNSQAPIYYFDASNQLVGIKTVSQTSSSGTTIEVISDTLVKGQEVTLSKITTTSSQGAPVTIYIDATLVEGNLVKNGNQITVTYKLSAKNLQDNSIIATTTTRTGTVSDDGTTIHFTQISLQSTPAQTTDVTTEDTSTWVLKTGNPLL